MAEPRVTWDAVTTILADEGGAHDIASVAAVVFAARLIKRAQETRTDLRSADMARLLATPQFADLFNDWIAIGHLRSNIEAAGQLKRLADHVGRVAVRLAPTEPGEIFLG